uniref:DUF3560 domain-containing protein n=1 Tax=viral metagenome TaxID=1070528 RepID=A0A6M3LZE3_9ZZZZ
MTYRERRQARADRLREWADKREAKSDAAFGAAQTLAEAIPFGQPILVGHHSEGRARRDRERIDGNMARGIEHARKADDMRERAENIERAASSAIYSDDPDAAEALMGKIERLEAQRARIVAYNASCRKARKADPDSKHGDLSILDDGQKRDLLSLMQVCPYQVRMGGQFPGYATSNLSGTINTAKKRLTAL